MNSLHSVFLRACASRLFVLTGLLALASVNSASAVSALWSEYDLTPDTHPNIPNCSYAGYHYGEDPIPHIVATPANTFDVTATAYGAKGNDQTDDTAAIRAALTAAKNAGGGVVYFPNGHYYVSGVLFVNSSNTVLRGESQAGTEIVFTQPLKRGYGSADSTVSGITISKWSYAGGMIWFGPLARGNTYRPAGEAPDSPLTSGEFNESWLTTGTEGYLSDANRGARSVTLDRTPTVHAGDFVLLRQSASSATDFSLVKSLAGGGAWADAYDWANGTGNASWNPPSDLQWVVEVAAVSGTTITFRQPLRFDVRAAWTPKLEKMGTLLRESGIEDMSLTFKRTYTWTDAEWHHVEEGWNAPYFNNAVHCWLRNVTMTDMDSGPNISASKLVTLSGFTLKASGEARMAHHHGTLTRASSHDNLICDFSIQSQPFHGLNGESMSTGNVWTRGVAVHGTFDSHRGEPFESIRTDVDLVANDGLHGGSGGPLMGARFVNWNVSTHTSMDTPAGTGSNYMMGWANAMPMGAIVGLRGCQTTITASSSNTPTGSYSSCRIEGTGLVPDPDNLYEAQLALRFKSIVVVFPDVIVDNTDTATTVVTGTWTSSTSNSGSYYGANWVHDGNAAKGTKSFSFKPVIPSTGDYQVYLRWPAASNRATAVPVDIIKSDGSVTTVTVNQRNNNATWVNLGLFTLSPSNAEMKIHTDGTTDGYVVADAVKVTATNSIVDNTETARVVSTGSWSSSTTTAGYYGTNYLTDSNAAKGTKTFSFKPVVPMSGSYNIYLRWTSGSNRASNVPVDIVQINGAVTTVMVDERTGGGAWVKLGGDWLLAPSNAEVKIRTDGTDNYVIVDAIKVTPATP